MATRRRSMAVAPRKEELPAVGLVKPVNRRRMVAPQPSKMAVAPSVPKSRAKATSSLNKKTVTKTAAVKKATKKPEKVDHFVAADQFDFGLPEMTPELPHGPITRSRRTSIYTRAENLPVPLPTTRSTRRKTIAPKLASVSESFADAKKPTPVTSTAVKSSKSVKVTINESMTPIVSLERLSEAMSSSKKALKPKIDNKTVLSAIPSNLTPVRSTKRKGAAEPVFVCTPQPTDPAILLRKNLKKAVESKIDERVLNLPTSSPYALLIGETENGSPIEQFVKAKKPERKEASKFVTATPAPVKRRVFEPIDIERNDGSPELPKRRSIAMRTSPKSTPTSPPIAVEPENESPVKSPVMSPSRGQFLTGDLAKACSIM